MITNTKLPTLIGAATPDADLCDGLTMTGTQALRLATNGELAGILAASSYFYLAMVLQIDSTHTGGCYLAEFGRTTGIGIGFHTNPVGNGNPAVCVAINDATAGNAYAARFEVDLRSGAGEVTLKSLELTYTQGTGFSLLVDGVAVPAAATGGTDNGMGGSSLATHCVLGGSLNLNTLRTRGALNQSAVVGTQASWPGADNSTTPDGMFPGVIAYVREELSPGVAVLDMPLINGVVDRIDTDNNGVNDPTNGTAWVASGTASFEPLIRFLLTDTKGMAIPASTSVTSTAGTVKPTTTIRLYNPSASNYACSNITPSESGVSSIKNYIFSGTDIPVANFSALTIAAGGYIEAVIEHDNSIAGDGQLGSVSFTSSIQDLDANFLVDVMPAAASNARRLLLGLSGIFPLAINTELSTSTQINTSSI